jgi:hypothetical protein
VTISTSNTTHQQTSIWSEEKDMYCLCVPDHDTTLKPYKHQMIAAPAGISEVILSKVEYHQCVYYTSMDEIWWKIVFLLVPTIIACQWWKSTNPWLPSSNTKLPFGMQATYFVTLRHYQPPIFQPFCQRGLLIWGVLVPSTQYKLSYALHTSDTSNQSKTLQEHKYRNNHTNLSKSKAKPLPP